MAEPIRVLIVEDEQRMSDLLVDVLPSMGFQPTAARTAEHAFRLMDQRMPDIIMLDLNLPVMGGMEFLEKLRQKGLAVPVIILTGYGSLDDARRAIRYEVVDFLTKPAHLGDIEAALERARRRIPGRMEATQPVGAPVAAAPLKPDEPQNLAEIERRTILEALRRHHGNRTAAAAELGISRRTLYNKLTEYEREGKMEL